MVLLSLLSVSFLVLLSLAFIPIINADSSKVQWYKSLDQTEDITPNYLIGDFQVTVDNVTNVEGNASLRIQIPTGSGEGQIWDWTATPIVYSYPPEATTLGFYFKINGASPQWIMEWINYSIPLSLIGFTSDGTYINAEYLTDVTEHTTNITTLSSLGYDWNWFEIEIYRITPLTANFYINGVLLYTESEGSPDNTWTGLLVPNFITATYYSVPASYTLDYIRLYKGEEYPPDINPTVPPQSTENGINLMALPEMITSVTGLPTLGSGIMATLILLAFAELPILLFASDNLMIETIVGILIITIGTGLTWLPFYTIIGVIFVIAILTADVFRKLITGQH